MVVVSLICAVTLLWSGIAKLIRRESALTTLRGLDLPQGAFFRYVAAAIPVIEIVIALSWIVVPAPYSLVPIALGTMLFLVFALVVIRARMRRSDAECMCFGSRKRVDRTTIARNVALVLVSSSALIGAVPQAIEGSTAGILEELLTDRSPAQIAAATLVVGSWLLLSWGLEHGGDDATPDRREHKGVRTTQNPDGTLTIRRPDGTEAHVSNPSPHVAFLDPEGGFIAIDEVASPHGVLLVMLSPTCSLCEIVRQRLEGYRESIAPVRVAVVGAVDSGLALPEGGDLGDVYGMASEILGVNTYPAALIALPDGTIPIGPVLGPDAIDDLVTVLASDLRRARAQL